MKNSADQGGCYPKRPKAEVDNTLRDLQNSSYPTKAEFNNCFIMSVAGEFRGIFIYGECVTEVCGARNPAN